MSVASKNPFAILDDEGPAEVTTPSGPTEAPSPATQPRSNKEQKPRGPSSRGGKYYQRGGAKNVARDAPEQDQESTPRESRRTDGENRGRGRGGRGGGGRGGRGRGRGREFDRHSGTFQDTEKKVNQGWGANEGNAELNVEEQAAKDVVQDAGAWGSTDVAADTSGWDTGGAAAGDGWGNEDADTPAAAPTNGSPGESRRPNREEEEDNSLTLDEYLAQKASLAIPKLESVRKANEGADESLWKDVVPLSKEKEEENYFIGKTKAPPKARAKKEEKVVIEIDGHFERPARGGRGRGGRGGERGRGGGGRGRGAPRGGRDTTSGPQAVNVEDQSAFPSLS